MSAKKAFLAKTTGEDKERLWTESNFAPLEDYISQTVGTGEARRAKLKSTAQTAQVVLKDLSEQARSSQKIIAADREQLTRLNGMMANMRKRSDLQVQGFLRGIDTAYARVEEKGEQMLRDKLKLFESVKLVFRRDTQWLVEFQRELETLLRAAIGKQMEHALGLLEGELKNVWTVLHESMQANFGAETRKQFGPGNAEFSEQRGRLFERIEMAMVENMADDKIEKLLHDLFAEQAAWARVPVGGALAAGGVLAAVVMHLAAFSVIDWTGATAVTTMLLGAWLVVGKAGRIVDAYRKQMDAKRIELTRAIDDLIKQSIDVFYQKAAQVYQPLEAFCETQSQRYGPVLERVDQLEKNFQKISDRSFDLGRASRCRNTSGDRSPVKPFTNLSAGPNNDGSLHPCPCCRARTLHERGSFECCPVCYWEDDGQGDHDADKVRGGPNSDLKSYCCAPQLWGARFGSSSLLHIRTSSPGGPRNLEAIAPL